MVLKNVKVLKFKNMVKNIIVLLLFIGVTSCNKVVKEKELIDFFLPIEPKEELVSKGIWGASNVLPRDISNGLEDSYLKHGAYWDGKIVKDDVGQYHMYASRWSHEFSHSKGWHYGSKAIHATSNSVEGPYRDMGLITEFYLDGKSHNTVALRTKEGKYAVVSSEITEGEVFISENPAGPFKLLGKIKIDNNGFDPTLARYDENNKGAVKSGTVGHMANVQIFLRPDDRYMIIARSTAPMISEEGILGPYKIMGDKIYKGMEGVPQTKMEDPTIWYSGGMYHMVVNHHGVDTSYHFTSPDGIHNWKSRGIAFKKDANIFNYSNGIKNTWGIVQRMTVHVENGHPSHFLFSVIDVHKGKDLAHDNHSSKIVIVPFDGLSFDRYMEELVSEE